MTGGIRAEVAIEGPENCPVAAATADGSGPVRDVTWTAPADGTVTEQFHAEGGLPADSEMAVRPLIGVGGGRVHRFEREAGGCACELVEGLGHPVSDVRAEDGRLVLTLHVPDGDALRGVVARLGEVGEGVELRSLVRDQVSADGDPEPAGPLLSADDLTDRQREVLRTAHEMGYFEHPREANGTEVAEALGIGLSTFTEHLAAAQSKLLDGLSDR